jgi:hypothetical protein
MSTKINRRPSLYGLNQPLTGLQQEPIVTNRDPLASDTAEVGAIWINTVSESYFILCSSANGTNAWTSATAGASTLTALTVNPGNITVTAGDVDIVAGDLTMSPGSSATVGSLSAGATTIGSTLGVTGNTTIGGTLEVAGDTDLDGNLDVTGNVTVNGDFDLTSADAISFNTTSNTDPAISFTANGGTTEAIVLSSVQGTAVDAIELISIAGGVTVSGGLNNSNAVNLTTTDVAGGMTFIAGTSGFSLGAVNGNFLLTTGTGAISIGSEATSKTILIGSNTGASPVTISAGTTGMILSSVGTMSAASSGSINLDALTGVGINSTAGAINIGDNGNAEPINIGTGAAARVITVGNNVGATGINLVAGTGNITAASGGTLLLDSVGVLELNSSAGIIGIGNDAVAQNINVGTGAAARTITLGNVSGGTSVVVNVGTGALNLGTSATAHATNVGSTTAGATLILNTPTGTNVAAANGLSVTTAGRGLSLPGGILVLAGAGSPSGTVTAPIGSLFLRSDPVGATSRAYINTDAGTTWTNITTAA